MLPPPPRKLVNKRLQFSNFFCTICLFFLLGYSSNLDAQSCPATSITFQGISYPNSLRGQIFTPALSGNSCVPIFVASNGHQITIQHSVGNTVVNTMVRYSGQNTFPVQGSLNGSYAYSISPASTGFNNIRFTFWNNYDDYAGVNTWDLTLISKHILGLQPFCSQHSLIAADVNNSHTVTSFDINRIKSLLLGSFTSFNQIDAAIDSWRFFPLGYQYNSNWFNAWQVNPLSTSGVTPALTGPSYPDYLNMFLVSVSGTPTYPYQLGYSSSAVAVKMGDVNFDVGNYICENFTENEDRSILANAEIQSEEFIPAGALVTLKVKADITSKIGAWQTGLVYNKEALEITDVVSPVFPSFDKESYRVSADEIRIVWYQTDKTVPSVKEDDVYFEIHAVAKKSIVDGERLIQFDNGVLSSIFFDENGEILTVQPSSEVLVAAVVAEAEDVAVYPTLFTNILTVNFGKNIENQETAEVKLLHLDGTLIGDAQYSIQDNQITIQGAGIGTLPSGMYLISVKLISGKEYRKKVIKA